MPLSPAQIKLNHRIGYLYPIVYLAGGVALLSMPLFIDGPIDPEGMIFVALIGLGALSWGGFSLWRHSRTQQDRYTQLTICRWISACAAFAA
jgi:hypothetical protein